MTNNIILNADSYKFSHMAKGQVHNFGQYPEHIIQQVSYIEPRVGGQFDTSVFFGLQAFIKEYLLTPITLRDVNEAEEILTAHGEPFDRMKWEYIIKQHNGFLPIVIEAVEEGTVMPTGNIQVQVYNSDPLCFWIPSWIETMLQRAVWYPSSVATLSREAKKIIKRGLDKSADSCDNLAFKLHDFGARGTTCHEQARIGGAAHLINFMGTDTVEALKFVRDNYGERCAGFSIPAMEHSSVSAWGESGEADAFANIIDQYGDKFKMIACVSDTYDFFNCVDNIWGDKLLQKVKAWGGTIVIRPDSGDPTITPVEGMKRLMAKVGHVVNSKGFYELPPFYRFIQGDGMNLESIATLDENCIAQKISTENLARGMGGGLLQSVNRDTLRYAQKLNEITVSSGFNMHTIPVCKNPKTDPSKASKKGKQMLIKDDKGNFTTISVHDNQNSCKNELNKVYENGMLCKEISFANVRKNAECA